MWTYFAHWKSVSQSLFIFNMKIDSISKLSECDLNQLEKLEAAKAAGLVYLSLLSLTGSYLALLSFI